MSRALLLAAALVLSPALAGCAFLEDGPAKRERDNLVRIVEIDPGLGAFGFGFEDINDAADVYDALGETWFEYTHAGASVPAADVLVTYVDEAGRDRQVPLSQFTTHANVGKGDLVAIRDVLLTSPMTIAHGGNVLASRGGAPVAWLEAGGYPLPLAARPGAKALWDVAQGFGIDGRMDRLRVQSEGVDESYSCTPASGPTPPNCGWQQSPYSSDLEVTGLTVDLQADLDGTFGIDALGTTAALNLELRADGVLAVEALADAHVRQSDSRDPTEDIDAQVGADVDASAEGDGLLRLRFTAGQLHAVGAQGSFRAEGHVYAWDQDHARSSRYEPIQLSDVQASSTYQEEELGLDDNPIAFIAEALDDLWRMDLAPGDEFRYAAGDEEASSPFGSAPSSGMVVRVTGRGQKTVPAGTFDALRVETGGSIVLPLPGSAPQSIELPTLVTWIDEDSGVPVAVEQTGVLAFDERDLSPALQAVQGFTEAEVTAPQDFALAFETRTRMELTAWDDGLQVAPMAAIFGPFLGVASPLAYRFLMAYGLGDWEDEEWAGEAASIDDIAVTASSPVANRLYLTLIAAGADAPYSLDPYEGDVQVFVDGQLCMQERLGHADDTANGGWDAGEQLRLATDCAGAPLVSATEHTVTLYLQGTVVFEASVVIR